MSDQWLRPLSHGNRGQQCESSDAFFPHKTLCRCPNKRTKILYCVVCTNIYISPHRLFNKANESHSLLPSSIVPPTLSIVLKESFLHPDGAAEEPLALSVTLSCSPMSVRGHASSSQRCTNTMFLFVLEGKCICFCQHTKLAMGDRFHFFSSPDKGPIKVYFSPRQL